MSWIRRVKRGNRVYLYEMTSVRENGKVKQKLIQCLGVESDQEKVPKPKTKRVHPEHVHPLQSFGAGDGLVLWKIAEDLNLINIIDRYTTNAEIGSVEQEGWKLICGVSKRTNEARDLISRTEPPIDPKHLVPTQCMNIYAEKVDCSLFGRNGTVVVYVDTERRMREIKSRNYALYRISEELKEFQKICSLMQKNEVEEKVRKIIPDAYAKYFIYSVHKRQTGIELEWSANTDARVRAERLDGKYLLYATDPTLSAAEVVMRYFERDYVEKVFRDLKTYDEIAPIRHRKESRVLGIIFACTLALRLKIALRAMLAGIKGNSVSAEMLLKQLGRAHQVNFQMDTDVRVWYVGLQRKTDEVLRKIGMKGLFGERVEYTW